MSGNYVASEVGYRSKLACNLLSENVHRIANEPSLGLYRIQNHCQSSAELLVASKFQVMQADQKMQGVYYDADYALKGIEELKATQSHISSGHSYLQKALESQRLILARARRSNEQ